MVRVLVGGMVDQKEHEIIYEVKDVVVRFTGDVVKTGYTLPVENSVIKKTVIATVRPATETGNISLVNAMCKYFA